MNAAGALKSRKWPAIVGAIAITAIVGACTGAGSNSPAGGTTGAGVPMRSAQEVKADVPSAPGLIEGSGASTAGIATQPEIGGGSAGASGTLPAVGPQVIKTADLTLSVSSKDLKAALQKATAVAGRHGGFVLSSTIGSGGVPVPLGSPNGYGDQGVSSPTYDSATNGTVVLRVPSTSFEGALGELQGLGSVKSQNVTGQDVSDEFIDLNARLRNWRAQEVVLLRLMDKAATISETIRVEGELSRVQLEIERIKGRLRYLNNQTSYATITANFTIAGAPAPHKTSTVARAWQRALDAALGIVSALIVGLGVILPIAVLLGLGWLVFRSLRPRLQHGEQTAAP